jgi:hypothetical protein
MASGNFVIDKGFRVASGQQITKYRAVKLSASETVTPVTAVGDLAIGVAQIGVTSAELLKGKGTNVRMLGITEMEADGAISVGTIFGLASDGRAASAAPTTATTRIVGICLKASGAAGDRITALLIPSRIFVTGS